MRGINAHWSPQMLSTFWCPQGCGRHLTDTAQQRHGGDLSMELTTTPSSSLLSLQVAPSAALALSQHQKRGVTCAPSLQLGHTMTYRGQSRTVPLEMRQQGTGAILFFIFKEQSFFRPPILNTSPTTQSHELAGLQGIREPSSQGCSWHYLDVTLRLKGMLTSIFGNSCW